MFAALLAAFLIETLSRLEEDPTATLLEVMIYQTQMMRNDTLPPYHRAPFAPSPQIVAVNALFFASLALILVVAFISMLAKGWIREFDSGLAAIVKPRHRALVREHRYLGLERWRFLEMIHFLRILIYQSLLLFFCGLSLFLLEVEATCGLILATIFALGILFYMVATLIAAFDDSAPFRSPLSRVLSHHFRRLHSGLLKNTTLWQRCLIKATEAGYPSIVRTLFYRIAQLARWKPMSEAVFRDEDGDPVWDEHDINTSCAVINKLYTSSRGGVVPRELFQSIILAGDPAHVLNSVRAYILLRRWAPTVHEMTPGAARVIGLLVCRTRDTFLRLIFNNEFVDWSLPILMGSREPWDQLLACLIQSQLPEHHNAARSLQSTHVHIIEAIHMMEVIPNRVLLIIRFIGFTVLPAGESERKAAAVRILSALLLQLRPSPDLPEREQLVHAILQVYIIINDIQLPDAYSRHSSLSDFPSFPYLAYDPGVLVQIINTPQLDTETTLLLTSYREFARTLIEWLSWRSAYTELDSPILLGLPLSRLEEIALDPPSGSLNNIRFSFLLLEALILNSGISLSNFTASDNNHIKLEDVLVLYDAYLVQLNAPPSLPMQNLLRWTNFYDWMQPSDVDLGHPWLALHKYTLMLENIPDQLVPSLEWSESPALNMIARDRLGLYYSRRVPPELPLVSLFLSSSTYDTILGAFQWYIDLIADPLDADPEPRGALLQNLEIEKIIGILFGPDMDEQRIVSSWILIRDTIVPLWSRLPNEFKQGFVSEFFKHGIGVQRATSKQDGCLGITWLESVWSSVLAPLVEAVHIEKVDMDLDIQELFDRNTGWSGPVEMEPEPDIWRVPYVYCIRRREERQQQQRARHSALVRSVDEVLSTLGTLLETAHEARLLSIEAVAHLAASSLLLHPRILRDVASLQRIEVIIEYYRPHICALPESTPYEAAMLSTPHTIDPILRDDC